MPAARKILSAFLRRLRRRFLTVSFSRLIRKTNLVGHEWAYQDFEENMKEREHEHQEKHAARTRTITRNFFNRMMREGKMRAFQSWKVSARRQVRNRASVTRMINRINNTTLTRCLNSLKEHASEMIERRGRIRSVILRLERQLLAKVGFCCALVI